MKLIFAAVRPAVIDRLIAGLEEIADFPGVTVSDVEGFGRRGSSRSSSAANPLKTAKQLMIAANDDAASLIVGELCRTAHTGRKCDGIIVTLPIEGGFHI